MLWSARREPRFPLSIANNKNVWLKCGYLLLRNICGDVCSWAARSTWRTIVSLLSYRVVKSIHLTQMQFHPIKMDLFTILSLSPSSVKRNTYLTWFWFCFLLLYFTGEKSWMNCQFFVISRCFTYACFIVKQLIISSATKIVMLIDTRHIWRELLMMNKVIQIKSLIINSLLIISRKDYW